MEHSSSKIIITACICFRLPQDIYQVAKISKMLVLMDNNIAAIRKVGKFDLYLQNSSNMNGDVCIYCKGK